MIAKMNILFTFNSPALYFVALDQEKEARKIHSKKSKEKTIQDEQFELSNVLIKKKHTHTTTKRNFD